MPDLRVKLSISVLGIAGPGHIQVLIASLFKKIKNSALNWAEVEL